MSGWGTFFYRKNKPEKRSGAILLANKVLDELFMHLANSTAITPVLESAIAPYR